ncbi:hypothetical protein Tco_1456593 [Tanacetum coccineum]
MDPNTSIRRLCLGLDDHVSLNDGFESEGQWDGSEFRDTADSGKKKETKAFTFYRMKTEEVSERYIAPYFVSGLHAYDGQINLEYEKNKISNEFAIKLLLDYEEKDGEKFDQHKKLLDSVLLDKLKLDGEVEFGEEASTKDVIRRTTSNFDGVFHQKFYVAQVRINHGESDSNDEEEYNLKRDKNGKPFYGATRVKYLSCDEPMDRALSLQEALNPFKKVCVWKKMIAFLGSLLTSGAYDHEASLSRPKRTRQHETVEEAMLPCVHHDFLHWGTSNRASKTKYNTNLAHLLPKQIYSPCIVDWGVLNNMDCSEEIEAMLEIKLYKMGGKEEIFSSEAWRRAFDINECIYTALCHEFYSAYDFDEISYGGFKVYFQQGLHSDENFNAREYWLSISNEEELHFSRSLASSIRSPILRLLQKLITYRIGRMEIRQGELERMSYQKLYHTNRYARVFEFMTGYYGVPL